MANTSDPRGFILHRTAGKPIVAKEYVKTASEVLYPGDLVKRVAAGTVQVCGAGVGSGIVGVCAAYAAAADANVLVYDDPDAIYVCETDGSSAYAVADNGLNCDVAAGTPDTDLRRSGMLLDIATKATTATLPFKILGLAPGVNGAENGAGVSATVFVKINATEGHPGSLGI